MPGSDLVLSWTPSNYLLAVGLYQHLIHSKPEGAAYAGRGSCIEVGLRLRLSSRLSLSFIPSGLPQWFEQPMGANQRDGEVQA